MTKLPKTSQFIEYSKSVAILFILSECQNGRHPNFYKDVNGGLLGTAAVV